MQVQDFLVFCFILLFFKKFFFTSIILSKTKIQINHTNFKILICCAIILYLLFRSLVETSFANFGIDFLIFFISFFYIELKKEKVYFLKLINNFIRNKDFIVLNKCLFGL